MTSALERRIQPELEDLPCELHGHDAASHREDVRVVVAAGQLREVQVVAERSTGTVDLVGGELPGTPSTVVDLTRYEDDGSHVIEREGAVPADRVGAMLRSP